MGLDINYSISKILTKQEIEDLQNGKLYFENYYSLDLITKEEAERIKKELMYDTLIDIIIPDEGNRQNLINQLEVCPETIEEYIFDDWIEKDEIPCSWEQKQDYVKGYDIWSSLEIKPLNYKGEELFILLEISYG